jgi:acyl-CoA thioester hydrolase
MRKHGPLAIDFEMDVAFHDTDLMQVVWHGHYLKYLENARWKLMDEIGFGFESMVASGYLWPIIDVHVRFVRIAKFGDRLNVRASLVEWESRLGVNYLVTDLRTGERVARGRSLQAAVDGRTNEMQLVMPAALIDRVNARLGSRT